MEERKELEGINLDGIKNSREIEDDSEEVTENESDEANEASFESNSKAPMTYYINILKLMKVRKKMILKWNMLIMKMKKNQLIY